MESEGERVARIWEALTTAKTGDPALRAAAIEELRALGKKPLLDVLDQDVQVIPPSRPRAKAPRPSGARNQPEIYQIKVTLKNTRPRVWRRIQVRSDITLPKLHRVLQRVMGWEDYHLHAFIIGGTEYGEPDPDFPDELVVISEKWVKLKSLVAGAKEKFTYNYDFGDDWVHELLVEQVGAPEEGARYPVCLAGERACPQEDCGGTIGYAEMLKILRRPRDPEYEGWRTWLRPGYDPERFDLDLVNQRLRRLR